MKSVLLFILMVQVLTQMQMTSVSARSTASCDDPCTGGACVFRNCADPVSCRGGACTFVNCKQPTCQGGACHFDGCSDPKCPGGGCDFFNTKDTLKPGYCDGESCKLDGQPHPSMREGHLSL